MCSISLNLLIDVFREAITTWEGWNRGKCLCWSPREPPYWPKAQPEFGATRSLLFTLAPTSHLRKAGIIPTATVGLRNSWFMHAALLSRFSSLSFHQVFQGLLYMSGQSSEIVDSDFSQVRIYFSEGTDLEAFSSLFFMTRSIFFQDFYIASEKVYYSVV